MPAVKFPKISVPGHGAGAVAAPGGPASPMDRLLARLPLADGVGDVLYRIGFFLEYTLLCTARTAVRVMRAVGSYGGSLLRAVWHALVSGVTGALHDLAQPFVTLYRALRQLARTGLGAKNLPAATLRARRRQVTRLVLGVLLRGVAALAMPLAAAGVLFLAVRHGTERQFVLAVEMNGQPVGSVANEQVFESARTDVQERLNNAHNALLEAGLAPGEETQWQIAPTYTVEQAGESVLGEGALADAMMQLASTDIGDATAVYVDGDLRFVTTEGDHLRAYLENGRSPQGATLEENTSVEYLHDIELVDGLYMNSSVEPYRDIISTFNAGAEVFTYTAAEGETVQTVVNNTGVSFDSLAMMNPDLQSLDQEVPAGTVITTGAASPELLKLKVMRRRTYDETIPFPTENRESSDYDFGKVVVEQEGEDGILRVTENTTFIDDIAVSSDIIDTEVIKEAVPKKTVTGTHLSSGMIASAGTGTFIWPVPEYRQISRWMGSGHRGADIAAPYGTRILASDGGAVVEAGWHYSWGNYVRIDHGNGWTTLYGHMSSIAVSRGQAVSQGQVIGYVGSTGYSFGNHCHFEMTRNGVLYSAQNLFGGLPRRR